MAPAPEEALSPSPPRPNTRKGCLLVLFALSVFVVAFGNDLWTVGSEVAPHHHPREESTSSDVVALERYVGPPSSSSLATNNVAAHPSEAPVFRSSNVPPIRPTQTPRPQKRPDQKREELLPSLLAALRSSDLAGTRASNSTTTTLAQLRPEYDITAPSTKKLWRKNYPGVIKYTNVCLRPSKALHIPTVELIVQGGQWESSGGKHESVSLEVKEVIKPRNFSHFGTSSDEESVMAAPSTSTPSQSLQPQLPPQRTRFYGGQTVLIPPGHPRNIAHNFADSLFVTFYYLSAVCPLFTGGGSSSALKLMTSARNIDFMSSFAEVFSSGNWASGVIAAAARTCGLGFDALLRNPTVADDSKQKGTLSEATPPADLACFEELVVIGTSRDGCVDATCAKMGSKVRDAVFHWVNQLKHAVLLQQPPYSSTLPSTLAGHPKNTQLRVGLYLREDMAALQRKVTNAAEVEACVNAALHVNGTLSSSSDVSTKQKMMPALEGGVPLADAIVAQLKNGGKSITKLFRYTNVTLHRIPAMPRGLEAQVRLFSSFDALIIAAGAASTNALWMPRQSAVLVLAQCSMGYISWLGRTKLPEQDVAMFKMCSKRSRGIVFEKPQGGGIGVPCSTLHRFVGGRLQIPFFDALRMLLTKVASAREDDLLQL